MDKWNHSTVHTILTQREYVGDVINFKTYSKSYKVKKHLENSEENMKIFLDVHKPIIDRDTWEKVQAKHGKTRKCTRKKRRTQYVFGASKMRGLRREFAISF